MFKTKIDKHSFSLVIEVNETLFEDLMEREKIYIGWNRCSFSQDYGIIRCFKRCVHRHTMKACKRTVACSNCEESHQ